tara:strand:- start:3834 stop:4289 length:456 start_codon:yes stop_codon:yes gene_type:complete
MRLPHAEGISLPQYQTVGSAGADLSAAIEGSARIMPGEWLLVPTGFAFSIPENYEGQIRPRSGLALKHGITVLNSPGTIDGDYRGEVSVLLINHGNKPFKLNRGDRIAQIVFSQVLQVDFREVNSVDRSSRGSRGYGSTGVSDNSKQKTGR